MRWLRIAALLVVAALASPGCAPTVNITVSDPKVYREDQILGMLGSRHQGVEQLAGKIQESSLQESFGVRQAVRYDAAASLKPAGSAESSQTPPALDKDLSLPEAPRSEGLGLTYREQLQRSIGSSREIIDYELLFAGDANLNGPGKELLLLRFDVSVNSYVRINPWWDPQSLPEFVQVDFAICGAEDDTGRVHVYWLGPEFDSIVSTEGLVTTILEDYRLSGSGVTGGMDVSGSGRMQRQLEEAFATLATTPLQFAIYGGESSEAGSCGDGHSELGHFAFALGPRRRVTKRSFINPLRYFSTTYRIDYVLAPGPRDVYALLVLDSTRGDLEVRPSYRSKLVRPAQVGGDRSDIGLPGKLTKTPVASIKTTQSDAAATPTATIAPSKLYPKLANSFLIEISDEFVTPETRVLIHQYAVPGKDVHVLGRKRLLVEVPASKALEEVLKREKGRSKLAVTLVTPDKPVVRIPDALTLADSGDPPKPEKPAASPALLAVSPNSGKAWDVVTIKTTKEGKEKKVDLTAVAEVRIGDSKPITNFGAQKKDELSFAMPEPPRSNPTAKVSFVLVPKKTGAENVTIADAFQYK